MVELRPAQAAAGKERRRSPNVLRKKLWRDMGRSAMQFVAIVLLCALGTWVYSGLDGAWRMLDLSAETFFERGNLADFWVNLYGLNQADVDAIANLRGVEDVQARFTGDMDCPDLGDGVSLNVHAFNGAPRINAPTVVEGGALHPHDRRGILIQKEFAYENHLDVGDHLTLEVAGEERSFIIRGLIDDAEHVITAKDVIPNPKTYGCAVICWEAVSQLPFNEAVVIAAEDADRAQVEADIQQLLPESLILNHKTHASTQRTRGDVDIFKNLTLVFPVLAFAVAALIVLTTLTRMIENQRTQMGTLKALGFSNRKIRMHYLAYAFVPSLFGALLGTIVGHYTLPDMLYNMEAAHYYLPAKLRAPISLPTWIMTGLMVVLSVLICLHTYNKEAREVTAELLRPKPPRAGSRILLEKWTALWQRFSFNGKMVVRNIARNKGRSFMSMVGVLCCNMLIICAMGLQDSIDTCVRDYYDGTVGYDLRADLDTGLSGTAESYRHRLEAERVEGILETSISLRANGSSRTVVLTVMEPEQQLLRFGPEHTVLPLPGEGLTISRKLMQVMKLSLGDTVEMWFPGEDEPVYMQLTQVVDTTIGQGVFLPRASWEALHKGSFRPTALLLKNPSAQCRWELSQMDEITTLKDPLDQYAQTMTLMDSTTAVFSLMYFAALGLAFVICYNMGRMNFTERTRDYATLKVLGYHQKEIRRLMMHETEVLTGLGTLLGLYPGVLLTKAVLAAVNSETMVYAAHVAPMSMVWASVITVAFSLCIEMLLTRKVRSIDMVEALKSVE